MSLDNAPDHVKLAVDLIALLEENNIANDTAIAALKIVLHDFERKSIPESNTQQKPTTD